jgi:16S rRNA processing protein RimM
LNKGQQSQARLVRLGRVVAAHGIRGTLKVGAGSAGAAAEAGIFAALGEVEIGGARYVVQAAVRQKNQVLLRLNGIDTREQAEPLVGQEVQGEQSRFPPLPPGEYYWFQLLGLPVLDAADGARLGHLAEIIATPGHDVYVVRQDKREILLPAVEEVIAEINLEEGWIKVSPPAGLLDAYAD